MQLTLNFALFLCLCASSSLRRFKLDVRDPKLVGPFDTTLSPNSNLLADSNLLAPPDGYSGPLRRG